MLRILVSSLRLELELDSRQSRHSQENETTVELHTLVCSLS